MALNLLLYWFLVFVSGHCGCLFFVFLCLRLCFWLWLVVFRFDRPLVLLLTIFGDVVNVLFVEVGPIILQGGEREERKGEGGT